VPGKLGFQEFHLIAKNILVREIEKFIAVGHEWHREQLHPRFFRGPVCLAMIAAFARGNDIGPAVRAAARYR
jgi:hypothetical protein